MMKIDIRDPEYVSADAIQAKRSDGSVVLVEPATNPMIWAGLVAQLGPYVPPVPSYQERLDAWFQTATIPFIALQDALIDAGLFDEAEKAAKKHDNKRFQIRWRGGVGQVRRSSEALASFMSQVVDDVDGFLDGLPGWDIPRPVEDTE